VVLIGVGNAPRTIQPVADDEGRPGDLVGRAREWGVLARAVERVAAGRGGVVLLAGEPGIGKTTLLADAVDLAARTGAATAAVTCMASGRPFWPWRQVLRALGRPGAFDAGSPGDDGGRAELFETVDEVLGEVARSAAGGALVIGIDDLQWADAPSLRLLALVGRSTPLRPVLIVGAYREAEVGPEHPLSATIGELGAAGSVLAVDGLAEDAVADLLASEGVDRGLALDVHRRTRGNPFFVREVAQLLHEDPTAMDGVPAAVGEVVRHRINATERRAQELLEAAAVAWTASDLPSLGAALGVAAADLVAPAEDLCRVRLLERSGAGYRFRHDVVRDAVLRHTAPERRDELSHALGSVLLRAADPARLEEAAGLLRVAAGRAPEEAGRAALAAASAAMTAFAPELAVSHLEWVLAQPALPAGVDRLDVLLALAEARRDAGDWDGGGDAFEEVATAALAAGDVERLTQAALGFGAGLSGFEVRLRDERQIELLRRAADALAGVERTEAAYVLARLSVALAGTSAVEERADVARRGLDLAVRLGDRAAEAQARSAWLDVISGPDHVDERLDGADRIIAAAQGVGHVELELLGRRFRVVALLEQGDLAAAGREVEAFAARAAAARPVVRWYVPLWRGLRALLEGRLDDSMAHSQEVLDIGARAGSTNAFILANSQRLALFDQSGQGIPEEMAAALAEVTAPLRRQASMSGQERAFLLGVALIDDDSAGMARHLGHLVADFGERDAEYLGTVATAGRAALALGDATAAVPVRDALRPYAGRWIVDGIGASMMGSVDELLAALDVLLGEAEGSRRLEAVATAYDRVPAPLLAERTRRWPDVLGVRSSGAVTPDAARAVLRREGSTWLARYDGVEARLNDGKGLRDCVALLARPGQELHVLELAGGVATAGPQAALDDTAVAAYRRRILDLQADVDEAEADHDLARAARAADELDLVLAELQRSLGMGGHARPLRDEHERARQAVRARIRYAIGKVAEVHPALGRHLEASVRTGTFCSYRPERAVAWEIHG
jgi:hypothetical protein